MPLPARNVLYPGEDARRCGMPDATSQWDRPAQSPGETMQTENTAEWVGKARESIDEIRERAEGWDDRLRTFAREKPLMAVLCAVAGGYALARLVTWR